MSRFTQGVSTHRQKRSYCRERTTTPALIILLTCMNMNLMHRVAFIIVIIGGLNWGLMGVGSYLGGDWNVVNLLLGSWMWLENLVYVLVGLSAVALIFDHNRTCRLCDSASSAGMGMGMNKGPGMGA